MREFSLAVVGADYPNRTGPGRRFEIALCKPGEPITLEREPKNPADPRAVKVISQRGVQLGYLTAERAGRIGALIAEGQPIVTVFQQATVYGAAIRVNLDGIEPTLPDPPPVVDEPQSFFADPDYSESFD